MADDSLFLIDIDKVLREKAPGKAKYIPRFVVSYLKRIVHQDELNAFLRGAQDKVGVDFLKASLDFLDAKLVVRGEENLPADGRLCTFVSNHPLGGQDGLALGYVLGTRYDGKIKYLVNDLLMNLHGLAPLCIPINKTGRQAKDFPRVVEAGFASDNQLLMFPAGLCSRRQKGGIIRARHQVQHRHALPGRRDAEEPPQDLHHHHREAHPLADVRQEPDATAVGTIR